MEWKRIIEGFYEVSDRGHIRRIAGGRGTKPGMLVRQQFKQGYQSVCLSKEGWARRYYVHRLVASAFLGPCPPNMVVNHKDGDKANNNIFNLEYVTYKQNSQYAGASGQLVQGAQHAFTKLTAEDVQEIRRKASAGVRNKDICQEFRLAPATVHSIVHGRTWKRVSMDGGTILPPKVHAPRAKVTEDEVRAIRKAFAAGVSQVDLCKRFGLSPGTMSVLVHGTTWKDVN